jgi:CBS domain-containing protein
MRQYDTEVTRAGRWWMIHGAELTDIALLMADLNLYSIPVVDEQDRVLGVVTVDNVPEATIPEDWRRREPAPRPVREITQPRDDRTARVPGGDAP